MKSSYLWLIIEQLVFISTLVSNMVFIAIRTCVRHKLQLDLIDEKRQLPNVDTIIAASEVANAFNAQFVPWAVNNFLSFSPTTKDQKGDLAFELQTILASNYISLFAITFLIFAPWKKGPECYLKFSPVLFYSMMYLNYVILPLFNFVLFIYYTADPRFDLKAFPLESWIVFFSIICFTRLTEFFFSLKKIVMDDARIYLQTRRLKDQGQLEQLVDDQAEKENENDEAQETGEPDVDPKEKMDPEQKALKKVIQDLNNDDCEYMTRTRVYGEGEVRIGEQLTLNEDIYSIGFISQLRDDIMKKYLDITTGKLNEIDG